MNEEKWTVKAREALEAAQKSALVSDNQEIKQEHLLSALLEDNGLIGGLLQKCGVNVQAFGDGGFFR